MAKYSDIKGFTVQTLDTDPIESTPPTGAWSSGGSLNDAKPYGFGCGGVKTAAVAFGGGLANDTTNESYDGTSWTENPAMSNGYSYAFGTGTGTDAIAIGGLTTPPLSIKNTTEEWNGSSWTSGGNLNTARYNAENMAFGPGTAAAFVGGKGPDYQPKMLHEQYNGSSWTETTDTPTDLIGGASVGIQTNAVVASGSHSKQPPGSTTSDGKSMAWDGSSWTEITAFSTARFSAFATGVYNDFILVGGANPSSSVQAITEKWNGSSWTEIGDLANGRNSLGGGKTESDSTSAVVFGGSPNPASSSGTVTEEFSVAPPTASIITEGQLFFNSTTNSFKETLFDLPAGSWSSGGDLNTARKGSSGFGVLTSNIVAGGLTTTIVNSVESYDGSSWTEITELNTARRSGKAVGSTTAGLVIAGVGAPPSRQAQEVENWNGSAWTEVGDINRSTATQSFGSAGASNTSAMIFGGEPGTGEFQYTETWDGSSWTEVNNLNTGRQSPAGFGIVTAAICAGGYSPPAPPGNVVASNESWDGTNWTEVNDLNTARGQQGGSGAFTAGLIYGGNAPPGRQTKTESWNGTSYTELNDMATSRYEFGYAPNGVSPQGNTGAIVAGGYTTTNVATTEEWAVDLANKTITSS